MKEIPPSDEVDLIRVIETIWDGKWKIIAITAACVLGAVGFQALGPAPNFVATTEIKPIFAGEAEAYRQSNALGFFAVYRNVDARNRAHLSVRSNGSGEDKYADRDRDRNTDTGTDSNKIPSALLDSLFIEQLGSRTLLANVFKNHELLVLDQFDSDKDYEHKLAQLVAKVSIIPPISEIGKQRSQSRPHWTVQFEFNHREKWLAALAELKDTANKNVRNAIRSRFDNLLASAKQKRDFQIEDLDAQISTLIAIYDGEIRLRLAYLSEQAAIARELDIAKQTNIPQLSIYRNLDSQFPKSLGNRTTNIESETPLYLRGYDVLEKEIELIKLRQDKRSFIEGLLPLEQKKLSLSKDQMSERATQLFAKTPVMTSVDFQAATFDINATEFKYESNSVLKPMLALVVGGMIGVAYVLISSAMRGRRETETGHGG